MKKGLFTLMCMLVVSFIVPLGGVVYANEGGSGGCDVPRPLGFTPWYYRLVNNDCSIRSPAEMGGLPTFIGQIVLNVLASISIAVFYAALGFLLYGGFLYITGQGEPGKLEKAKKTIMNAVIGLIIALASTIVVNVLFSVLNLGGG